MQQGDVMSDKYTFMHDLCQILLKKKALSANQVAGLERTFGKSSIDEFDDFLLEEGIVNREDLLQALSEYYRVPSFDVNGYFFDRELLHNFPKDFLLRTGTIPLEHEGPLLVMVAANPNQEALESAIRNHVQYDINFFVGLRRDIADAVKEFYEESITEVEDDSDLGKEHAREEEAYQDMLYEEEVTPTDENIAQAIEKEIKEEEKGKRKK